MDATMSSNNSFVSFVCTTELYIGLHPRVAVRHDTHVGMYDFKTFNKINVIQTELETPLFVFNLAFRTQGYQENEIVPGNSRFR